ncbi:MAG: hypothetical protein JRH11_14715 [Deltaproteobacteria bacterium]|nr:hypothetical protein [Deltaproteobacteria bacterium]
MTTEQTEFEVRVEVRAGYVFVWQRGLVGSANQLEAMQRDIGAAMDRAGTRWAIFDNRETEPSDEWLRAAMWTWLCEHVDRAALIQTEARNIGRAERTGQRNRILVRAFHEEAEAEAWLLGT